MKLYAYVYGRMPNEGFRMLGRSRHLPSFTDSFQSPRYGSEPTEQTPDRIWACRYEMQSYPDGIALICSYPLKQTMTPCCEQTAPYLRGITPSSAYLMCEKQDADELSQDWEKALIGQAFPNIDEIYHLPASYLPETEWKTGNSAYEMPSQWKEAVPHLALALWQAFLSRKRKQSGMRETLKRVYLLIPRTMHLEEIRAELALLNAAGKLLPQWVRRWVSFSLGFETGSSALPLDSAVFAMTNPDAGNVQFSDGWFFDMESLRIPHFSDDLLNYLQKRQIEEEYQSLDDILSAENAEPEKSEEINRRFASVVHGEENDINLLLNSIQNCGFEPFRAEILERCLRLCTQRYPQKHSLIAPITRLIDNLQAEQVNPVIMNYFPTAEDALWAITALLSSQRLSSASIPIAAHWLKVYLNSDASWQDSSLQLFYQAMKNAQLQADEIVVFSTCMEDFFLKKIILVQALPQYLLGSKLLCKLSVPKAKELFSEAFRSLSGNEKISLLCQMANLLQQETNTGTAEEALLSTMSTCNDLRISSLGELNLLVQRIKSLAEPNYLWLNTLFLLIPEENNFQGIYDELCELPGVFNCDLLRKDQRFQLMRQKILHLSQSLQTKKDLENWPMEISTFWKKIDSIEESQLLDLQVAELLQGAMLPLSIGDLSCLEKDTLQSSVAGSVKSFFSAQLINIAKRKLQSHADKLALTREEIAWLKDHLESTEQANTPAVRVLSQAESEIKNPGIVRATICNDYLSLTENEKKMVLNTLQKNHPHFGLTIALSFLMPNRQINWKELLPYLCAQKGISDGLELPSSLSTEQKEELIAILCDLYLGSRKGSVGYYLSWAGKDFLIYLSHCSSLMNELNTIQKKEKDLPTFFFEQQ